MSLARLPRPSAFSDPDQEPTLVPGSLCSPHPPAATPPKGADPGGSCLGSSRLFPAALSFHPPDSSPLPTSGCYMAQSQTATLVTPADAGGQRGAANLSRKPSFLVVMHSGACACLHKSRLSPPWL